MQNHISAADGIRGLACTIVLATHTVAALGGPNAWTVRGGGKIGVWLFFCLSAYLLTRRIQSTPLSAYARSRFLRIYPLYVIAVVVSYFAGVSLTSATDLTSALSLTGGFGHFWTIPTEVGFYVLLPSIAVVVERFRTLTSKLLLLSALAILTALLFPFWQTVENSINVLPYLPVFLFGMMAAYACDVPVPKWCVAVSAAALVGAVFCLPGFQEYFLDVTVGDGLANKYLFFGTAFALVIWTTCGRNNWLSTALDIAPLRAMGRWSYPIYLFHMLAIVAVSQMGFSASLGFITAVLSSVAIGAAVHHLFEKRIVGGRLSQPFNLAHQRSILRRHLSQSV